MPRNPGAMGEGMVRLLGHDAKQRPGVMREYVREHDRGITPGALPFRAAVHDRYADLAPRF